MLEDEGVDPLPLAKIGASLEKKRVSVGVGVHVPEHHLMVDPDPSAAQTVKCAGSQQSVAKEGGWMGYLIEQGARIIQVGVA